MLKIGEFSRLGRVPVKTLRYYDGIGLLKPARVDPFTGYRYYDSAQLDRLNRILALKDLDLSLEQIAVVLDDELTAGELRRMLQAKRAELQSCIAERREQLARVEARLRRLQLEETLMQEVTMKKVPAQRVLAHRQIIPEVSVIGKTFDEVNAAVARAGIPLAPSPWLALYHHEEYREHDLDFEIAVPVPPDFQGTLDIGEGRTMTVRDLPAETMACITIHLRDQEDVRQGNQRLAQWVRENGYRFLDAPCREAYGEEPAEDGTIIFETQFPVEKE